MKKSSFVLIFCAFFVKNGQASKLSFEAFPKEVVQNITPLTPTIMDWIYDINSKMGRQQQDITQLEQGKWQQQQEIQQQQQAIQQQHQNISNLQQDNQNQQQEIQKQAQRIQKLEQNLAVCSVQVAFQASLSLTQRGISPGYHVVYDNTMLNEGNAYDNTTGAFTCALPGIYVFNVQAVTNRGYYEALLSMTLNNATVSGLAAGVYHDDVDAASMSAVLHLKLGDVVKVEVARTPNPANLYNLYGSIFKFNLFNGHIVQPDGCKP